VKKKKGRRAQGEGTIIERADGRWAAVVDLGWIGGRRQRKWLYGTTQQEVLNKLTETRHDQHSGLPIVTTKQTVGDFLKQWLEQIAKPNTRPKTFEVYAYAVRYHLLEALGRIPLAKLTTQDVQGFLKSKSDSGLSAKTVKHLRDVLRNALNVAVEWDLILRNPAAKAKPPRAERKEMAVFDPDQARLFAAAASGHRLEAFFTVALALGLRRGEALGLHWNDLSLATGQLSVRHTLQRVAGKLRLGETKTPKSRATIRLPQILISAFHAHRVRQDEERLLAGSRWVETGYVFTTQRGTPLDPRNALRSFYSLLKAAGLPRLRFHDLRHSAATLLLAQGVHPRIVMELLRHENIATTMDVYSHVIPMLQQEAADKMDQILNPLVVNLVVKQGEEESALEDKLLKRIGRGEWIRTTDLLVPNQAL